MNPIARYRRLPVLQRTCVLLGVLALVGLVLHFTGHGSVATLLLSATLVDSQFPSLVNVAKRLRPQGGVETNIAELLSTLRPELEDIPWEEGNLETGHQITARTGLPSPTKRAYNQGILGSKTTTGQYIEGTALYEEHSKIDVELAKASGDPAAYRMSEDTGILEGFGQSVAKAVWYDSAYNVAGSLHGLAPRYGASTGMTASSYVFKPGTNAGTNCQSIWLVKWSPGRIYGIYPKGSVAGLKFEDKGELLVQDPNGALGAAFFALVGKYVWKPGIAVQDYRHACRFQWDPDDTTSFADTAKTGYLTLNKMITQLFNGADANTRFYMSRKSYNMISSQLSANDANFLSQVVINGRQMQAFLGIPLRVTDTLVDETAIS